MLPLFLLLLGSAGIGHCVQTTVPNELLLALESRGYNARESPTYGTGRGPTPVAVSMYIEGLSSFRAQTMDFHTDIYFQERWVDERLAHNHSHRVLIRERDLLDKLWLPDLYFANARDSSFHHVTGPNFLLWIERDGSVMLDSRISLTVICIMDLAKYPLDSQHCPIRILSYAYDVDQMLVEWSAVLPIDRNPNIKLSDMALVSILPGSCNGTYLTGVWSCITAEFRVQREMMHHILQNYIPTTLIVVISWFSFWLDVDAVPGRVSLCITTLLTLATQASAARLALPQVSYIKAIDVWMGMCLAFVFGVMIEFTIVNYWARRKQTPNLLGGSVREKLPSPKLPPPANRSPVLPAKATLREVVEEAVANGRSEITPLSPPVQARSEHSPLLTPQLQTRREVGLFRRRTGLLGERSNSTTSTPPTVREKWRSGIRDLKVSRSKGFRKAAQRMDQRSRVLFPAAFALFNFFYWIYYLCIA